MDRKPELRIIDVEAEEAAPAVDLSHSRAHRRRDGLFIAGGAISLVRPKNTVPS